VKYSKRTVDEAVQLLDCYANGSESFMDTAIALDCWACSAWFCALAAWREIDDGNNYRDDALEAAQRLREGWRP
jgi:hypothetical protein